MNKFKKIYPFNTKLKTIIADSEKRSVHKNISLIVDGDSKTLELDIEYKNGKTIRQKDGQK